MSHPAAGTPLAQPWRMHKKIIVVSSGVLAAVVAVALFLRPTRSIQRGPEMATPERIPPALQAVIASKMRRHAEQLPELISRAVVLDYDGVARVAGAIFDEPRLARPVGGDELNGVLPERFFVLQDQLQAAAHAAVEAAARQSPQDVSAAAANLTRTCVDCHAVYLNGAP